MKKLTRELDRFMKKTLKFAKANNKEAVRINRMLTDKAKKRKPNTAGEASSELIMFITGLLLLGGGVFWLLNTFQVHTSFGEGYYLGSARINSGVILLPLLIGVALAFFLPGKKRFIGYGVMALGLICIVLALISSVSISIRHTSLFAFVLMLAMIFAGAGLLMKSLSGKK